MTWNLFQSRDKTIWVNSGSSGKVNKIVLKNYPFSYFDLDQKNGAITGLYEEKNGQIWLSTNGNGLIHYDSQKGIIGQIRYNPEKQMVFTVILFSFLFPDSKGQFWLGYSGNRVRLDRFDPTSLQVESIFDMSGTLNPIN